MNPRQQCLAGLVVLGLAVIARPDLCGAESAAKDALIPEVKPAKTTRVSLLEAIKPKSMQKQPTVFFSVMTEMTEEGRKRRQPTAENPVYYLLHASKFTQLGTDVAAGEKPPPVEQLETAMRNSLAAGGYLATNPAERRPELLITFTFGSHGIDAQRDVPLEVLSPPRTAAEVLPYVVSDPSVIMGILSRAKLVAGEKFAWELKQALDGEIANMRLQQSADRNPYNETKYPISPDFGSPFQMFIASGKNGARTDQLVEMMFGTCYFVVATAYDYDAAEKKEHRPLWRTKMAVEADGVSLAETLGPLISTAGPYFGHETTEAVMVKRQINREGTVKVGTPTLVEENAKTPSTPSGAPKSEPGH